MGRDLLRIMRDRIAPHRDAPTQAPLYTGITAMRFIAAHSNLCGTINAGGYIPVRETHPTSCSILR
jgi:hypothetical protein